MLSNEPWLWFEYQGYRFGGTLPGPLQSAWTEGHVIGSPRVTQHHAFHLNTSDCTKNIKCNKLLVYLTICSYSFVHYTLCLMLILLVKQLYTSKNIFYYYSWNKHWSIDNKFVQFMHFIFSISELQQKQVLYKINETWTFLTSTKKKKNLCFHFLI